jgi:cell division control protein 11
LASSRRKNVKKALQFTLMVVGASGLGKSTFINTLCDDTVITRINVSPQDALKERPTQLSPVTVDLEEEGVKMQLTLIDTPGFGDSLNSEQGFRPILSYIEQQFDDILAEESRIKRNPRFQDNRVHALLYFIAPTGHALKEADIQFMKKLATRVNVIPVIAKADTLTPSETVAFKKRIMEDIIHHQIPIFSFPVDEEVDDDETIEQNSELRNLLPFTVIGAETEVHVNGRAVRCREYPWGIVEVENTKHCDFTKLRYVLLT